MPERYWTVHEANAALDRVTAVVQRAREAAASLQSKAESLSDRAGGNGHGVSSVPERDAFQAAVTELAEDGIVLRELFRGLVDFPARAPSGREYWLCWVVGEPRVAWWHWPEDGFAGRTPISEPPE